MTQPNPFAPPAAFTTRPTLAGTFGAAASTHWIASATAQAVLERGGNAFDAAVAAAFVLHVAEPHLNGPGGDLVAIVAPANETPRVLAGQGPAPAGASASAYRALGLTEVPGAGLLAAAVPGAVDAWLLLLRDLGTWDLAEVWAFAIDYARHGIPLVAGAAATIARVAELFAQQWPSSAAQWTPGGEVPAAGTLSRNLPWAATLEHLLAAAPAAASREQRIEAVREQWANGFVAAEIERFAAGGSWHSSGTVHSGVIAAADLAAFRAGWEEPLGIEFRGHTVLKAGAWSQGPALLQTLRLLEGFDDAELDPATERGVHLIAEALKLAYADRDAHYGDGAQVPIETLLSSAYAAERRTLIDEHASELLRPGLGGALELRDDAVILAAPGAAAPAGAAATGATPGAAARGAAPAGAAATGEPTLRTGAPGIPDTAPSTDSTRDPGSTDSTRGADSARDTNSTHDPDGTPSADNAQGTDNARGTQSTHDPADGRGADSARDADSTRTADTSRGPGRAPEAHHESTTGRRSADVHTPGAGHTSEAAVVRGDTCHLDVVDRWGNLVSATPSGGWLQSSPYIPALGFALGTRLQMTSLQEARPTMLTPGLRPRTTLTPTVLLRDGRPYAALGSPGGDQQDQWQLPFLLRHLIGGYELQQAIDAPAFHTTHLLGSFAPHPFTPAELVVESRLGEQVIAALRARGHRVEVSGPWSLGRLSAVTRGADGVLRAGANPRGAQGYAVAR